MACTVTVDMTGILVKMDTMNGHLADIITALTAIATGVDVGAAANLLTGSTSWLATLAGAVVSNVLQTNIGTEGDDLSDNIASLRKALVPDGFHLTLAERIAPDLAPSLAQRLLQWPDTDPPFVDLGAIADRMSPLPTDIQCDRMDAAWDDAHSLVTDNIADQVAGLVFQPRAFDL